MLKPEAEAAKKQVMRDEYIGTPSEELASDSDADPEPSDTSKKRVLAIREDVYRIIET